ncbi:MAG: hypothetical protein QM764_00080 [Chitinophagaceae bacterium]
MKSLLFLFLNLLMAVAIFGQRKQLSVQPISLPPELSYYDNQFSGLQIANNQLYLMSESRLEDKQEAKLYSIALTDINRKLKDTAYALPYKKLLIYGLDSLRTKMDEQQQFYEGLEAFIINGETIYFSVETNTPSEYCYLLIGKLKNDAVYLEPKMLPVRKPRMADGSAVYNAGFEAITLINKRVYAFYEYNYFTKNYAYSYNESLDENSKDSALIDKLPFRITDITHSDNNHFTAINFFYKGEGKDTVYRVPHEDKINDALIEKQAIYNDYCRLIDISFSNNHFSWRPLLTIPPKYTGYNWEGIAAWKDGYFIMNDKYTLARPYASVLLYLQ